MSASGIGGFMEGFAGGVMTVKGVQDRKETRAALDRLTSQPQSSTESAPKPKAKGVMPAVGELDAGFDPASFDPSVVQGIRETADALQIDPEDFATMGFYETAGTLDPTQLGPTTQWGQHQGLIQFGKPQAEEYGVDFSSRDAAWKSQLGADGAIVRYAKAHGFVPGKHNALDLYSTVNAGAPGKYSASDANNGGAPGSVRDKWENQMGGHRAKARSLLSHHPLAVEQSAAEPQARGVLDAVPAVKNIFKRFYKKKGA